MTDPVFAYGRSYRGPVRAVIFDLAGTVIDHGSLAPAGVFVEVFARRQVALSVAEARGPMGAEKRLHIAELMALPAVRERWIKAHGREPGEADIDSLYADFIPLQIESLPRFAGLIPGVLETVSALRARSIKIGANTGYNRAMMEVCIAAAGRQGLVVDSAVAASDVPRARPFPSMCLKNMVEMSVETVAACVKVDDTVPGIDEGLNAGMWTVALAVSGNEVGLDLAGWQALSEGEQAERRARAYRRMYASGAHYVIDSVADLMPVIDDLERRLAGGERP